MKSNNSLDSRLRGNDMRSPLVSIVMPVYNAGEFLVESIESITAQTYKNWELIVVNDNSSDNSAEIVREFQKQFPRKIKLVSLKKNLNVGGDAAANVGIEKAHGTYIAKMDADDIAHPERLEKQVAFLETHPDIFLVGTNADVINREGQVVGEKKEPTTSEAIFKEYINFHPMIHPSIMFRNHIVKTKKFYSIRYPIANDYYTLFTLICKGYRFANLPEKLLYYRIYGENTSLKNIRLGLMTNLKIKRDMVIKYSYPLTKKALVKNLIYGLAGFILPQKVSYYLYLFAKGIIPRREIGRRIVTDLKNVFRIRKLSPRFKSI